ncbi:MAG: SAM-dependent chlorinase/fluorinase [Planctomycetota bacterium]
MRRAILCFVLPLLAACSSPPPPPPVVALLTDFGEQDDAVGLMRGVILSLAPQVQLVDLTHQAPRFDVAAAARLLLEAPSVYPPGTVFVVVVDPGVGTARRAVVARLDGGSLVVAPDNGVLTLLLAEQQQAEVRELTNPELVRKEPSATFHGRDVFAPAAGHLAAGRPFADVGPLIRDYVTLELARPEQRDGVLLGEVLAIDRPFGNVWTNLPGDWLTRHDLDRAFEVRLGEQTLQVPFVRTFGDVPEGESLLYVNSRGTLALALNRGDFAASRGVAVGAPVRVLVSPAAAERDEHDPPRAD